MEMRVVCTNINFYPRSPCGERLRQRLIEFGKLRFLSTLSLRRATARRASRQQPAGISIHALLAESDAQWMYRNTKFLIFLSTLSLRRATLRVLPFFAVGRYFYPRSPCGERPNKRPIFFGQAEKFLSTLSLRRATVHYDNYNLHCVISIHALLAESDVILRKTNTPSKKFLSTLSLRRATAKVHKTVGYFCAYETNFMEIASSC